MHVKALLWAAFSLPVLSFSGPTTGADALTWAHPHGTSNNLGLEIYTRQEAATSEVPPLLANSTQSDIERARAIVKDAIAQAAARNKARLENPSRNNYGLNPASRVSRRWQRRDEIEPHEATVAPPLLNVTDEMRKAAALVAEADAWADTKNGTLLRHKKRAAGSFWLGNLYHGGRWPFGDNPSDFEVFRDVTEYGAKGDGVTDDTEAIRKAVEAGKACGAGCYSSTTKGAIIYFPPGTYLVSGTIETHYGTQFIGDAIDRPVIKAAPSFIGLGVISTDKYVENGGTGSDGNAKQWYINTANFYRQIRNFVIDITATDQGAYVAALHYQVAQATSLQFVEFRSSTNAATTQQAIYAENGSGGFMSDLVFNGGAFGIYGGSQQFTAQRLTFNNVRTAVQLIWDWGWSWTSIQVRDCGTGFKLTGENGVPNTGSVMITDSVFSNTPTGILIYPPTLDTAKGSTGVTLDNVNFDGVTNAVVDTTGKVHLAGGTKSIDTWVLGRIYVDQKLKNVLSNEFKTPREPTLLADSNPLGLTKKPFFERAKPQYEKASASEFVHVSQTCRGDGVTDDTVNFQAIIDTFAGSKIIYVDAGSYLLTDTIYIPSYARIVGEVWSQLVASGPKFEDVSNPRPLLRVGNEGERGTVEMQDLIFTSKGPTAGVVFVEWNIRAAEDGSAGMWDCHARVGGAVGTELESYQCPPTAAAGDKCKAGSMLMHVTPKASGYFENVWLWVADHDIDDPDWADDNNFMTQCSVFVARGILIESTTASWYYGTASEHAVYYQYALQGAKNVHMSMIQTEQPYYQPTPQPPAPFTDVVGLFPGDPSYGQGDTKDYGWGLTIRDSSDVSIHGAGLYSWFSTYSQTCLQTMNCQTSMVQLQNNGDGVRIHNLVTIGAVNMIEADDKLLITAKENQAVDFHPRWSQIAIFDPIQVDTNPCTGEPDLSNPEMPETVLGDTPRTDGVIRFVVFNGSPYNWKLTSKHSYQMGDSAWDDAWVDIPAGESLQLTLKYAYDGGVSIHHWDDQGEAYFEMEGTSKKFHFHAWVDNSRSPRWVMDVVHDNLPTTDVANGATVSLVMPQDDKFGKSVQWGLVGSELYGYYTTTADPPVAWMQASLDIIGDRKLKHVCMPGSHDAGMSKIDGKTPVASPENTQTQFLDIYHQAVRGSRWFDVRPCLGNGGAHMLCHYGDVLGLSQGANGQSVQDAIDNVNAFMRDHPGELLILDISDEAGFDTDNRGSDGKYPRLTKDQWAPILDRFKTGIERPCRNKGSDLTGVTMYDFIGDGAGCVASIVRNIDYTLLTSEGQYPYSALGQYNSYSETDVIRNMAEDQVGKLHSNRVLLAEDDERTRDQFFILSWTLTGAGIQLSIRDMAVTAFTHLFSYAFHEFTPFSYPNVLYVDYLGARHKDSIEGTQDERMTRTSPDIILLALAVNLQLASQNCYVGGGSLTD